jgi:hypothetical protein
MSTAMDHKRSAIPELPYEFKTTGTSMICRDLNNVLLSGTPSCCAASSSAMVWIPPSNQAIVRFEKARIDSVDVLTCNARYACSSLKALNNHHARFFHGDST